MVNYSWHEDFFKRKVFPQICKDAGECAGFYAWLEIGDRQLYDEILRLEQEIDRLWLEKSDQDSFRRGCQDWYEAAMKGIGKWREAIGATKEPGYEGRGTKGPEPSAQARLI
jgi:hypothetical protein